MNMKKYLAIIVMCCAFALALGLAACGGSSSGSAASGSESSASASSSAEDEAKAEYDRAVALFDEGKFFSAKEAFEKSGYQDWEQRAAACVQPMPETGELWHNENMVTDEMILEFAVNEDNADLGRYIAVYSQDKQLAATLFVKGGGTVSTGLPGGNYYIKDAKGTEWYGSDELFGSDGNYETMVFDEIEGDRYLTVLDAGYEWTITINTGSGEGQNVGSEEDEWGSWK